VTVSVGDVSDGFYAADDRVGIPEGKREQISGVGYSTAEDGTGFGPQIVEQIVTAHGWEIRVIDGDDGRARFESTASTPTSGSHGPPRPPHQRPRHLPSCSSVSRRRGERA